MVAVLVFLYLAIASSGGRVPLQALSPFFRFVSYFDPMRQILDGVWGDFVLRRRGRRRVWPGSSALTGARAWPSGSSWASP